MQFYVWYDNFLEELFAMEKIELDSKFLKLKSQLECEKVVFNIVEADNQTHAFQVYKESLQRIEMPEIDEIPGSLPIVEKKSIKKHLH